MHDTFGADGKKSGCEADDADFPLSKLRKDATDKLGNTVREVLFVEASYAIYCSDKGIFVHFSDSPEERGEQRKRYTEIVPELCELRYLTAEMKGWNWFPSWRWWPRHRHTLYHHNMAQALMLVMENKIPLAKEIAKSTLTMAVQRVTSDNTIRYVRAAFISAFVFILIGVAAFLLLSFAAASETAKWRPYLVGGMFGAVGAAFSIATRAQAFKLKPCDESRMNRWMATIRVVIGVTSAMVILLFADTLLNDIIGKLMGSAEKFSTHRPPNDLVFWQIVALLSFVGGFAERLIPNILGRTADQIESSVGTPVQDVRNSATAEGKFNDQEAPEARRTADESRRASA
jgi:hypothetical protein